MAWSCWRRFGAAHGPVPGEGCLLGAGGGPAPPPARRTSPQSSSQTDIVLRVSYLVFPNTHRSIFLLACRSCPTAP